MSHKVITIGRQFGSGGHEIAQRVSDALEIPLYDRNLVELAADRMGMSPISVEEVDESVLSSFLSTYRIPDYPNSSCNYGMPLDDSTYAAQSAIIENLAKRGPCVIVGRCSDYVLRFHPGCINLFLCASIEDRIKRIMERYHLTEREAASAIRKTDRRRRNYYETYTDQSWGRGESHQLMINVSRMGIEGTVDLIKYLYEK